MLTDDELSALLQRLRVAALAGNVDFEDGVDDKAARELLDMDWTTQQALDVLAGLVPDDYDRTEWSRFHGGVDLHTFIPPVEDSPRDLFIRIYERGQFVCVSFHWA